MAKIRRNAGRKMRDPKPSGPGYRKIGGPKPKGEGYHEIGGGGGGGRKIGEEGGANVRRIGGPKPDDPGYHAIGQRGLDFLAGSPNPEIRNRAAGMALASGMKTR